MLSTNINALYIFNSLHFSQQLDDMIYYYLCFPDEEIDTWKGKQATKGHMASKWLCLNLNISNLASEPILLANVLYYPS